MTGATNGRGVRPEIQALRAVAVSLVVVGHLWPAAVPGGFVGVDVFFAISGFLITTLLLRELERTGRIDLVAFWARRARRILPAALVTLLFCSLATVLLAPVIYWQSWFAELRASTLYAQNWRLADTAVDYFAADDAPSPVQHFWSLSVEEQFYLVWPVLLGIALAAFGRSRRLRRGAVALAMAAVTVVSFAWAVRQTRSDPAAAYFQTPGRAWEFGVGGLLASAGGLQRARVAVRAALSWGGLAAIAVAALSYDPETPFPGVAAALPVLGALAVIAAGVPPVRWAPGTLLRARPVQAVGDISYSLYLWHWPLLVLAPFAVTTDEGDAMRIVVLALTLAVAFLSKRLVEDPVRAGTFLKGRPASWTFGTALAGTAAVLAVISGGASQVEAETRAAALMTQQTLSSQPACFGAAARDTAVPCRNPDLRLSVVPTPLEASKAPNAPCRPIEKEAAWQVCAFGVAASEAETTVALIGDSHAGHWRGALDVVAKKRRWRALSIGRHGCPLSKAVKNVPEPDRSECVAWNKRVLRWLADHPEVTTVFVSQISGGRGVVPSGGWSKAATAVDGYQRAWRALPASVQRLIVIRDTPKALGDTDVCVQRAKSRRKPAGPACAIPRSKSVQRDDAAVAARRGKDPRVGLVDLTPYFCDRRRCLPVIGGALVWKDQNHMTAVYAKTLGPYLGRAIDQL